MKNKESIEIYEIHRIVNHHLSEGKLSKET